jgi:hypothetical protein
LHKPARDSEKIKVFCFFFSKKKAYSFSPFLKKFLAQRAGTLAIEKNLCREIRWRLGRAWFSRPISSRVLPHRAG